MTLAVARKPQVHWAWIVAGVSFIAIIGAAGFRAVPSVMMDPLHDEFGWSHATVGAAMSINMTLFGLTAPFSAALMDRYGIRRILACALTLIAAGTGLSTLMTQSWQLILLWGVLVGIGTGSISMGFVATISSRWFVSHRGLVTGILTAANATGQLIFLPVIAAVTTHLGWRWAAVIVTTAALAVVPLVLGFVRNRPSDIGLRPLGDIDDEATPASPTEANPAGTMRAALGGLTTGITQPAF